MNYAEQIRAFELRKTAAIDRQKAIMDLAATEGRSLEDEEQKEFDGLETELGAIDGHVERVKKLEARDAGTATVVTKTTTATSRVTSVTARAAADKEDSFAGQSFTRICIARALSHLDPDRRPPWQIAQERWGKTAPTLVQVMKAGIAGGGSGSGEWGAELVQVDNRYTGDFIDYLNGMTVYDKLGLREVPAHVTIKGQDGQASANWVGESKSIPVSKPDFSTVSLTPLKVAALCVVSKELLRYSSPSAEQLVRDSLVQACSQRIDTTFLSTTAASSGVSPAGILNGLSSLGSNGNTAENLRQDIRELYAPFLSAFNATGLTLVMNPSLAKSVSLMVNALGQTEFPGLTASGGTLLGDRVVTGDNVGATHIILIKASDIWRIGDAGVEVSVSDQATIEQDGAPAGASDTPTAASATIMSMFGTDSVAFKIVRPINYQKRRTGAVTFISDAQYGIAGATTA